MAQPKQLAAILAASALLLISLCTAGGLVWWYSDQSAAPPGPSATGQQSSTAPTVLDTQISDINLKLNSLPNWTLWGGSWQELHPGLRGVGVGDSGAEFNPDLPGNIRITFTMNVVNGMRPRVYLEGPGVYFGNEGSTMQLSIFGPGVRQLHGNPIPYKNGQLMHVAITIDRGSTTVLVDNNAITCQCHLCDRVRLRLEGGDNWSQGTTEFGNIQIETIDRH